MSLTVSVVIPAHNSENTLRRAVESSINQKYPVDEVIIVENCSSDGTLELAAELEKKYATVHLVQSTECGASKARNLGLERASSEWIQFLDADDELLPEKIQEQINLIRHHQGASLIAGAYKVSPSNLERGFQSSDPWMLMMMGGLGITSSNLWRREAVMNAKGWNEELKSSQEADLMFRMLASGTMVLLDMGIRTVIHQGVSDTRISTRDESSNAERFYELRTEILDFLSSSKRDYFDANAPELVNHWYKAVDSVRILSPEYFAKRIKGTVLSKWKGYLSLRNRFHLLRTARVL